MRNREELVTEANDLIEVISTYKVLKLDQILIGHSRIQIISAFPEIDAIFSSLLMNRELYY